MYMQGNQNMQEPSSKVELSFSCKGLADMDVLSKSDPMLVLYVDNKGWKEFGRTEMIKDNLNPKFVTKIIMPYYFERIQRLRFCVFDIDNEKTKDLSKQDFIGQAFCNLGDIVTMPNNTITLTLKTEKGAYSRGTLFVSSEEVQTLKYSVLFQFRGENLDKKDFFGKSDPYLVISRRKDDGTFTPVLRTPHIIKTLNPAWDPISASAQTICNGDMFKVLLVECFDWNKRSKHELIGSFETTLDELTRSENKRFDLLNPKKKHKTAGTIYIQQCKMIEEHTFLDFISGGCEMKLMIAIDFTASNGNPSSPTSLHYVGNPNAPNDYIKAIRNVGDILCTYDSTKQLPVFGFGAKLADGRVSHCFYLNGSKDNPEVNGVGGVLQAYVNTIQHNVILFGPTNFADVINLSTSIAKSRSGDGEFQSYCILLILTDGIISDMDKTIDAIVQASDTPLSIIIVGIGNADFSNMDVLDADDNPLVSPKYGKMKRDIVQFVPFNQYKHNAEELTKAVLEELPAQVVGFFKSKGIVPNPPGHGIHQTFVQQDFIVNEPIPSSPVHLGFGQLNQNNQYNPQLQGFSNFQQGQIGFAPMQQQQQPPPYY